MRFLKLLGAGLALLVGSALGGAGLQYALAPSTPDAAVLSLQTGAVDPSAIRSALNSIITSANTAWGQVGGANIQADLNLVSVATGVNALGITPGGTGIPLRIGVATGSGGAADTNADLSLEPAGTGLVRFGCGSCVVVNGSKAMSLGSTGPAAASATPNGWLVVRSPGGGTNYIPLF